MTDRSPTAVRLHGGAKDITGQRFGRLVAIEPVDVRVSRSVAWRFACDCGEEKVTTRTAVAYDGIKSCGCLRSERSRERVPKMAAARLFKKPCAACSAEYLGQRRTVLCKQCRVIDRCQKISAAAREAREAVGVIACAACQREFAPRNARARYCCADCKNRVEWAKRNALRKGLTYIDGVNPVDPYVLLSRDKWRCQECGIKTPRRLRGSHDPRAPEVDHIIPLSKGGEHSYRNTQCLCRACNLKKSATPRGQLRLFG